ncbi:MAG TPA: GNAT family N-acetyltransferase [Polyangiaceae bacterium]|nr:GNAT family N-acetyltransferase [Polyangiaceae bacterium]
MTVVALERRHRSALVRVLERSSEFRPEEVVVAIELLDAALGGDGSYRCWVAEDERAAAVGYACFGRTPLTAWTFDLYWLAVDPAARRARWGRRLVERVVESVRAEGGRVVRVETSSKYGGAVTRAFYTNVGFAEAGRIAEFYGEGDDLALYALSL